MTWDEMTEAQKADFDAISAAADRAETVTSSENLPRGGTRPLTVDVSSASVGKGYTETRSYRYSVGSSQCGIYTPDYTAPAPI